MQSYQQFQPTPGYAQILGGGQAQSPATQGLDFGKIGDWATQMAQKTQWAQNPQTADFSQVLGGGQTQAKPGPDWQKILQDSYGATKPTLGTGQQQRPMQAGRAGSPLGQVNGQPAGYIGGNTMLGLLGSVR